VYKSHAHASKLHASVCIKLFAYSLKTYIHIHLGQFYIISVYTKVYNINTCKCYLYAYKLQSHFCKGIYQAYVYNQVLHVILITADISAYADLRVKHPEQHTYLGAILLI